MSRPIDSLWRFCKHRHRSFRGRRALRSDRSIAGLSGAGAAALALLLSSAPLPANASGDALADRWRDQGVAAILPDYPWAREAARSASASARNPAASPWSVAMLRRLGVRESVEVRFQGGSSRFADAPSSRADGALPMPTAQALPFASGWFDSSLAFGLREGERVEASAIVVYQRFAAWDLGWLPPQGAIFGTEVEPRFDRGLEERVYGYRCAAGLPARTRSGCRARGRDPVPRGHGTPSRASAASIRTTAISTCPQSSGVPPYPADARDRARGEAPARLFQRRAAFHECGPPGAVPGAPRRCLGSAFRLGGSRFGSRPS